MRVKDVYFESVNDLDSQKIKIEKLFVENIIDLKDENALNVRLVFMETIVDYPIGQSVS